MTQSADSTDKKDNNYESGGEKAHPTTGLTSSCVAVVVVGCGSVGDYSYRRRNSELSCNC